MQNLLFELFITKYILPYPSKHHISSSMNQYINLSTFTKLIILTFATIIGIGIFARKLQQTEFKNAGILRAQAAALRDSGGKNADWEKIEELLKESYIELEKGIG